MSNADPLIEAITPKTNWYVVLRPFSGDVGKRFVRGEVVDTSDWRFAKVLVENRYIAPLPFGSDLPEPDGNGVRFINLDKAQTEAIPAKKRPTPVRK